MPESGTYGSVRGAISNGPTYRDRGKSTVVGLCNKVVYFTAIYSQINVAFQLIEVNFTQYLIILATTRSGITNDAIEIQKTR